MSGEQEIGGAAARVVLVTAPDADCGRGLARALVDERLAACVGILPGLTSVYRWEGQIHEDAEVLLVIKSRADRLERIEARVAELHPYDVPECVSLAPDRVEPRYLAWLQAAASDAD